jgi:hypothetical protein
MASMMRTHETAGVTAAAARVMSLASMATRPASTIETGNAVPTMATSTIALGLGYGWQSVGASPCDHADFAKAINTNKRQPRRLGQRTT